MSSPSATSRGAGVASSALLYSDSDRYSELVVVELGLLKVDFVGPGVAPAGVPATVVAALGHLIVGMACTVEVGGCGRFVGSRSQCWGGHI